METIVYSSSDEKDSYDEYIQDSYNNETSFVESWHDNGYSISDFEEAPYGGALEPKPPNRYSSSYTKPSYPKPWISWNPIPRTNFYPTFHPTHKVKYRLFVHNGSKTYGPEFFLFLGFGYLQWESNMDYYFEYHSTPQEDKLSIALGQLKDNALWWWDQDEYNRWYDGRLAIRTWERLKWNMCAKYSPQSLSPTLVVQREQKPTFLPQVQETTQGKCTVQTKHVELTCYWCKEDGHVAKICPTREAATKTESAKRDMSGELQVHVKPSTDFPTVSFNKLSFQRENQVGFVIQWFKSLKEKDLLDAKHKIEINFLSNDMFYTETCQTFSVIQ